MEDWESLLDQLREELLLREDELRLLHNIDLQLLDTERTLRSVFAFVVGRTQELLKADHAHILLQRGRSLETTYSTARVDIGQRVGVSDSITGTCFLEDRIVNVHDTTQAPFDKLYVPIQGREDTQMLSVLAAPIKLGGANIGVLNVESTRTDAFRAVHERVAKAVAAQVAMALQRVQLFDEAALFADVDKLIFSEYDSKDVLQAALERVMEELRRQHLELSGAQILFRRGADDLEIVYSTSPSDVGLVLSISDSICGRAVRERRTVVVGDVSKDRDYRRMLGSAIQSEVAVPILVGDDQVVIGVLNVESEEPDAFSGYYELVLNRFADKVRTLLAFTKLRGDVTEALELRSASDLLVAVGDQTSNMIHRLNNTVGAMRFRIRELQSMQAEGSLAVDEQLYQSLQALLTLADRTLEMPEKVTNFLNRDTNVVVVNDCVESTVAELDIPTNVTVELHLDSKVPALPLYSFDIVVQNLLRNAIDAMPDGGTLSAWTSLVSHPELATGYVQLLVRDTGMGIPEDIQSQVFELNFTTKREKEGKGLGLGLWWVRNFIRRAKGEIALKSTIGVGTEVTVKIPYGGSTVEVDLEAR